ncbi:hypothetical protein BST61_g10883 [Cercospora zeina]
MDQQSQWNQAAPPNVVQGIENQHEQYNWAVGPDAAPRGIAGQQQQYNWEGPPNAGHGFAGQQQQYAPTVAPDARAGHIADLQQRSSVHAHTINNLERENYAYKQMINNLQQQLATVEEEAGKWRLYCGLAPDATKLMNQAQHSETADNAEHGTRVAIQQVVQHLHVIMAGLMELEKSKDLKRQLEQSERELMTQKGLNVQNINSFTQNLRLLERQHIDEMTEFRKQLVNGDVDPEFRMSVRPEALSYYQAWQVVTNLAEGWVAIVEKLLAAQEFHLLQIEITQDEVVEKEDEIDELKERCETLERGGVEVNEIRLSPGAGDSDVD